MSNEWLKEAGFETLAIREGLNPGFEQEHSDPIYATSSFVFESAEQAAATFSGERDGNTYSRFSNPTVSVFEKRLAALEGGQEGVATSSGMAAILTLCLTVLRAGDHVICSRNVFGSTVGLFNNILTKLDISVTFVALRELDDWRQAVIRIPSFSFARRPLTRCVRLEISEKLRPLRMTRARYSPLITAFVHPRCNAHFPGRDVAMHSATKYLDGQGRVLGGALVGSEEIMAEARGFVRVCGPSMSPFNAWIFSKGLETLQLRMDAHSQRAQALAEWLKHVLG